MSVVKNLLTTLFAKGIVLTMNGEKLKIQAPDGALTPDLIGQLKYPYDKLIKPRKQARIINNQMNLEFTNNLKRLGIITSNREIDGEIKAVASV